MAQVTGLMLHDLPLDRERLHQAAYPVWVVMGQRDVISIRHSREISELFPIHKLYVQRREGHRLAQRKYKIFNQMIRELVRISRKRGGGMKRLLERLQPLKAAVKSIFFISITVLVVIELVRLKRTITLESLESALAPVCLFGILF